MFAVKEIKYWEVTTETKKKSFDNSNNTTFTIL